MVWSNLDVGGFLFWITLAVLVYVMFLLVRRLRQTQSKVRRFEEKHNATVTRYGVLPGLDRERPPRFNTLEILVIVFSAVLSVAIYVLGKVLL